MNLVATDPFTALAREKGISTWESLKDAVAGLAYGRTSNPKDLSLVLKEGRGTCSGKHAFLACVAKANGIRDIHLIAAIFKMSADSTPKIRGVLSRYHLDYIPEAHCYLVEDGKEEDYTRPGKFFHDFESKIFEKREIDPENVSVQKTAFHQEFLRRWLRENKLPYTFEELWQIREACIASLGE